MTAGLALAHPVATAGEEAAPDLAAANASRHDWVAQGGRRDRDQHLRVYRAEVGTCAACPLRDRCTASLRGRTVNVQVLWTAGGQNLKRLLARRGWGRRPFPAAPGVHLDAPRALPAACWLTLLAQLAPCLPIAPASSPYY